jgi:hypothetical protein
LLKMTMSEEILEVFNEQRTNMINFVHTKEWKKVNVFASDLESLVDDLPSLAYNSKANKAGFENREHIRKYLWNTLRAKIKIAWMTALANPPKLTDNQRRDNFIIARDIINKARR